MHDKRFFLSAPTSGSAFGISTTSKKGGEEYNKIQNMKHSNTILKRVVKQIASGFFSFHLKHALSSDVMSDVELVARNEISFRGKARRPSAERGEIPTERKPQGGVAGEDNQINHLKGYKTMKSVSTFFVPLMRFKYAREGAREKCVWDQSFRLFTML